MYKKSIERIEEVVKMYQQDITIRQIRIALKMSEKTVKNILLSRGIDSIQDRKDKLDQVIKYYNEGKSQIWMEQNLKMTRKTIRELLKERGVYYRTKSEQWRIRYGNALDETVFDDINEESAYWLGMLYTDGHISSGEKGYNIEFGLHSQDREHLDKYLKFLKSSNSIKEDKRSNYLRIKIGSEKLHKKLQEYGMSNKKSWDAVPPLILQNNRDFWRGCIDGDGGIYTPYEKVKGKTIQIMLCGTIDTIVGFISYCENNCELWNCKQPTRMKGKCLYQVSYYGEEVKMIGTLLYKDAKVYLDRKYDKYLEITGQKLGNH